MSRNVVERLAHGDLKVDEIDRLGDEVEGAAVHRGAQIGHVAIGRDDDCAHLVVLLAQPRKKGQTVHHRHVDVEHHQIDVRLSGEHLERFRAVPREARSKLALANLPAEAMGQLQLEIGLVVDDQDADGHGLALIICALRGSRIVVLEERDLALGKRPDVAAHGGYDAEDFIIADKRNTQCRVPPSISTIACVSGSPAA